MWNERNSRTLKTVETSFEIIDFIIKENGATLSKINDNFSNPRSSLYTQLITLEDRGLLNRDEGEFNIGLEFLRIGEFARNRHLGYVLAKEVVRDLAQRTGEEADFTAEDYGRLYSIQEEIDRSSKNTFGVGVRYYLHATGSGKAILAEMDESEVDAIIDKWGLPKLTENTITDRSSLMEELDKIRDRGYAINNQELVDGLMAIAMVSINSRDEVMGAFSVGAPEYRISHEELTGEILEAVSNAVNEHEKRIQSSKPSDDAYINLPD